MNVALPDTAPAPYGPARCPKCGSTRTSVTARVIEDAKELSLFRCETCDFRFTHLSSAES